MVLSMLRSSTGRQSLRLLRSQALRAAGARELQTAAEAAETVSYTRGLFLGVNNAKRAFPYPKLSEEEKETLQMLVEPVNKYFANNVDARKIDETKQIPPQVLQDLKELGLFGLQIPEELDGLGLSNTGYARVCEEFTDGSLAVTMMAHQSIGLKGILLNGNEEQVRTHAHWSVTVNLLPWLTGLSFMLGPIRKPSTCPSSRRASTSRRLR